MYGGNRGNSVATRPTQSVEKKIGLQSHTLRSCDESRTATWAHSCFTCYQPA